MKYKIGIEFSYEMRYDYKIEKRNGKERKT